MVPLRHPTPRRWVTVVTDDLDAFLKDHAANERKVSASAIRLAVHYPAQPALVEAMIDLAREELDHFKQVYDVLHARGQTLGVDEPDPYMGKLRRLVRKRDEAEYLLDRLITFGIVEARACERFQLLSERLEDPTLRALYTDLARAEARHHGLFLRLARTYFPDPAVDVRVDELLDAEGEIVQSLPLRAALH
jgi:tRNA-(ms[2]io[6]A)-hydroxylase